MSFWAVIATMFSIVGALFVLVDIIMPWIQNRYPKSSIETDDEETTEKPNKEYRLPEFVNEVVKEKSTQLEIRKEQNENLEQINQLIVELSERDKMISQLNLQIEELEYERRRRKRRDVERETDEERTQDRFVEHLASATRKPLKEN